MKIHIGHHFYGAGNLGDDLMMAGFLQAWDQWDKRGTLACAIPFDRMAQQQRFPQVTWLPYDLETRTRAIRDCSVWLGLGGPAFETDSGTWMLEHMAVELELCQRFHKPMFFLCVGVSNREALDDPRNLAVLDYAEHIWTRDEDVAARLRKVCGTGKITSGADLAHLFLETQSWPPSHDRRLGWLMHFDDSGLVRPDAIAEAIARLPEWEHCWLVQEVRELRGSELATLQALPAQTRKQLTMCVPDYLCAMTDQLLNAWPVCETVLTSRFHGALISAWRGSRVAVVERNDKLRGLANTLGCQSIPAAADANILCQAISSSAVVERSILEQQQELAQDSCAGFFRLLNQGKLGTSAQPKSVWRRENSYDLPAEEIEQFHRRGFLGPFTAFSPEEMAGYGQIICDQVLKAPSPYSAYPTQLRHLDSHTVWQLCSAPAIVDRLASLYGPDLLLWYSNFFDKGPARPGQPEEYPWHQDTWHWKLEPLMSLSVWLAITPATIENGCVEIIPGTHTQEIPALRQNDARLAGWFGGQSADPSYSSKSDKVSMVLQAGQFFIFSERTLHHSNPNRTRNRRLGLSFRVTLPRVKSDRSHPCLVLSGQDKLGLNPTAAPPTSDPDPSSKSRFLPDAADFSLDQPVNGLGWHLAEADGGVRFRWTGPEENSWLDFDWQRTGDGLLRCRILAAVSSSVLESLEIQVNALPIPLSWKKEGRLIEVKGIVPGEVFLQTPGRARISFHVAETLRFCDLHASSNDTRRLGLAISHISLTSPGKSLMTTDASMHPIIQWLKRQGIVYRLAQSIKQRLLQMM